MNIRNLLNTSEDHENDAAKSDIQSYLAHNDPKKRKLSERDALSGLHLFASNSFQEAPSSEVPSSASKTLTFEGANENYDLEEFSKILDWPVLPSLAAIPTINPATMTLAQSMLLGEFLQKNTDENTYFFHRDQVFIHNGGSFCLTHSLLVRKCNSSTTDFHYEIIDHEDQLGEGSFATVYGIKGTLNIINQQAVFDNRKSKVIKEQIHSDSSNPIERLRLEFLLSPIHLHMKMPVLMIINQLEKTQKSLTVMERFKGSDLFAAFIEQSNYYTGYELVLLAMNLADALLQQVHDHNVIHRDLKLENIMMNNLMVSIIDFGLSILNNEQDSRLVGTEGYIPPEARRLISNKKRDVYALGIVLCLIFGGSIAEVEEVCALEEKLKPAYIRSLFSTVYDLENYHKVHIDAFLKKIRNPDPEQRPTPEEIFAFFNRIRFEIKLKIDVRKNADLIEAFKCATQLKTELNRIGKEDLSINNPNYIRDLKHKMLYAINTLKDSPEAIVEFIAGINLKKLNGINSKFVLTNVVTSTLDEYRIGIQTLNIYLQKLLRLNCSSNEALELKKTNLLVKINAILNKQKKYKTTFDNLFELNEKLKAKIRNIDILFNEISQAQANCFSDSKIYVNATTSVSQYFGVFDNPDASQENLQNLEINQSAKRQCVKNKLG